MATIRNLIEGAQTIAAIQRRCGEIGDLGATTSSIVSQSILLRMPQWPAPGALDGADDSNA